MKTQEEIEQLAESIYNQMFSSNPFVIAESKGYIKGYNQCQQDMAKDIEYWQEEFDHWYKQAMDMADKYNALLNKQD